MDKAEITNRFKTFLEREFPNQGLELTESTDLLDAWFVDSLGIVETVLFIDTSLGIPVSRADINGANFKNLATLSEFVWGRSSH